MKVSIATPCHDRPELEFVHSLIETMMLLRARGHRCEWFYISYADLARARNEISHRQLVGGADVCIQIDADHQWQAEDLVNAIEAVGSGQADMVGFPITGRRPALPNRLFISPGLIEDETGARPRMPFEGFFFEGTRYAEVYCICGVVVCSRACLEKLSAGVELDAYDCPILWAFGAAKNRAGKPISEDLFFSRRWRQMGGKIHCAIDARVGHVGKVVHTASYVSWLSAEHQIELDVVEAEDDAAE